MNQGQKRNEKTLMQNKNDDKIVMVANERYKREDENLRPQRPKRP